MRSIIWVGLTCGLLWLGCGSSGPELGTPGAYGGPCLPDGSCNDDALVCVDHVCKYKDS